MTVVLSAIINPYNAELFLFKRWRLKLFFHFEIIINILVSLSDSFEYLCYVSPSIINILILLVQGPSLYVRIRRQIPTYKDRPRAERVDYI